MMKYTALAVAMLSGALLAGCGGSSTTGTPASLSPVADIAVPNITSGSNFGFDIGTINGSQYLVTDRSNAAVDVIDIASRKLVKQIKGTGALAFAGSGKGNSTAGPDGINVVGNLLYVGDVNSVKIVDPASQTVIKNIVVGTEGVRADEGCFDPVHHLYMINTPEAAVPYSTFINTDTQTVVAKVTFVDSSGAPSAGLEACEYEPATDTFYTNNDGTTANPHGEFVKISGADVRAIPAGATVNFTTLANSRGFPLGDCDPTGLALGPNGEAAVSCREATTNSPLLVQIVNRTTGALVTSINAGGGDEIAYDASTNRYYNAASRWTANGLASAGGACSAASPCTPILAVIDATSHQVVAKVPTGNNAHSVAVDPVSRLIFMPYSSSTSPAGCSTCGPNGYTNGGISVFQL